MDKAAREKAREYQRRWRAAHPEEYQRLLAAKRQRRAANPDLERQKGRERERARYQANAQQVVERVRAWKAANPDKVNAQQHRHYDAHRERVSERGAAERAAERELDAMAQTLIGDLYAELWAPESEAAE